MSSYKKKIFFKKSTLDYLVHLSVDSMSSKVTRSTQLSSHYEEVVISGISGKYPGMD